MGQDNLDYGRLRYTWQNPPIPVDGHATLHEAPLSDLQIGIHSDDERAPRLLERKVDS